MNATTTSRRPLSNANPEINQDERIAVLDIPALGKTVAMMRFDIVEGLSELFEMRIHAVSRKDNIDDALGKPCSITYHSYGKKDRYFNGIVAETHWVGSVHEFQVHRLVVRPKLWLLSRKSRCKIFQRKTVEEILKIVLVGFDVEFNVKEKFEQLEYCVQYRETDLAFASRLMEQYGYYYFFKHEQGNHVLNVIDAPSAHEAIANLPEIQYHPEGVEDRHDFELLAHWTTERRFRSGKVQLRDYYEMTPSTNMTADKEDTGPYPNEDKELYDYPGKYKKKAEGQILAKIILEAEQAQDRRRYATGDAANLFPGGKVKLKNHPTESEKDTTFLVLRASHTFTSEYYRSGGTITNELYHGSYEFLLADQQFRAPIVTPKPIVYGPHTAFVVGPAGEEIYIDKEDRIKVQFHWDREGKRDQDSSCFIRVAQPWAGKGWGHQFIPRIGMEAVVEFLEGDPDRPLVTGTVYNGEYKHPYPEQGKKTQSGIKTRSSIGGGEANYNEFMFEDKKGEELIRMHAEKDHLREVENDETIWVGHDRTAQIDHDDKRTIANNQELLVAKNRKMTIGVGLDEQIGLTMATKVGATMSTQVGATVTLTVGAALSESVGTNITIMAGANITIMAGISITLVAPTITLVGSAINLVGPTLINGCVPVVLPA